MSELVDDLVRQLDGRIRVLETVKDPVLREEIFVVLKLVDQLHRIGITRLADRLRETDLFEGLLADEDLRTLFTLYDLVPLEDEPEEPEEVAQEPRRRALPIVKGPVFERVLDLASLAPDRPVLLEADGRRILVVREGDRVHAYGAECPSCRRTLDGATLAHAGAVLVCPWNRCSYDARSGQRLVEPGLARGPSLQVIPATVRDGHVLIAVGVAPVGDVRPPSGSPP